MTKKEIQETIIQIIGSKLSTLGFKHKKNSQSVQFKRKTNTGFDFVAVYCTDYEPIYFIGLTYGKRIEAIENICNLFLDPILNVQEIGKESYLGILCDEFNDSIEIRNTVELNNKLQDFSVFIEVSLLPKFKNYESIFFLDEIFNKNGLFSGFGFWKNIVIAKLASNPHYDLLVEEYREKLKEVSGNIHYEHHSTIYENIVKHLETI